MVSSHLSYLWIIYKLILNFGELWRNLVNFGEIWWYLEKFGEIWWNLEKSYIKAKKWQKMSQKCNPQIFCQNSMIWVSMDFPGPQESVLGWFGPSGPNFGPKGLLAPNSKINTFLTKPLNMGVYGLAGTPAISFEVIWTPGPKFGPKGLLAPN